MKLLKISGLSLPYSDGKKISIDPLAPSGEKYKVYLLTIISAICIISISAEANTGSVKKIKKSIDWFSVFYEHTDDSAGSTVVYRPFYMEASDNKKIFQASLMPLVFWRYKSFRNDVTKAFFGFYESTDYKHPDAGSDYDNGLFPLFFYGNGERIDDKYIFIYPLGGNIRGKLGYERISPYIFPGVALFFLFPPSGIFTWQTVFWSLAALVPVYTEFENRDYNGTALFWPLITWGSGDKRSDFRFLPFYSHHSKTGWYDNYSYLFLINYRKLILSDDEKYTFFFFPLFGKKWSKREQMKSFTVLWPFFSWGYDNDKKEKEYNLPWPVIQIQDCERPRIKKRIFFPFWGRYTNAYYDSLFVTPLYFSIEKNADYFKSEYHITCLIAWYFKRDYSYQHEYYGNSWRYFKLWPLFQWERSDSGLYSLNVLSLLPFRDMEGYEKLYQPFWTIFEYREKTDGEKHLGILLRTYYQVWNNSFFKMKIPVILNYERCNDELKEFTMLLSSFGYKSDNEGSYLKLFWIPLKIGEGSGAPADNHSNSDMEISDMKNFKNESGFNPWHGNYACTDFENNFYFKMDFKL